PIPYADREHSVEPVDDILAPFLVAVDDDFGVRPRHERVAASLELVAQLPKVVNLAIESHADRLPIVQHRLVAELGPIDDRQATMPEPDAAVGPQAGVIGAAMAHHVAHRDELGLRYRSPIEVDDAADSAHGRA